MYIFLKGEIEAWRVNFVLWCVAMICDFTSLHKSHKLIRTLTTRTVITSATVITTSKLQENYILNLCNLRREFKGNLLACNAEEIVFFAVLKSDFFSQTFIPLNRLTL